MVTDRQTTELTRGPVAEIAPLVLLNGPNTKLHLRDMFLEL